MGTLHDLGAEGMDADKFREDMTVFFDELSEAVGEMDLLRDEMIEVGEELIDLYQTNGSNLEQDPLTEQLLHILDCLKKVMLPILKPAFEGPDGIESMATDIALHFDSRVQALKSALEACPLAQSAHKSDYMHWLVCHAKQQCLFMLQKPKRHISEFNCQTTEHFNKILKRLVERLHGFTRKGVGKTKNNQQGEVDLYNKFGFVMRECIIRLLHFPGTIVKQCPKQTKCTKCRIPGHNRKSCTSA